MLPTKDLEKSAFRWVFHTYICMKNPCEKFVWAFSWHFLIHEALLRKGQLHKCWSLTVPPHCLRLLSTPEAWVSGRFHRFCKQKSHSQWECRCPVWPWTSHCILDGQSSNSAGKKQSPGSIWHRQSRRESTRLTGKWEQAFAVDLTMTNEISSEVHSWLICCCPAPGQLTAIKPTLLSVFTTGLRSCSQQGLSFLPAGYLLFFKPTAGGSACGDGVFLSKSARFYYFFYSSQFASCLQPKLTYPC